MPISSPMPLLFCQCVIFFASFEGILCPMMDSVIESFGIADMYSSVEVVGQGETAQFILKKKNSADGVRQHVVLFSSILDDTLAREENNLKVASFSVQGEQPYVNYNIKFRTELSAQYFVENKALREHYKIRWARIYSTLRPVIISYDLLEHEDDIGFKLLDNDNHWNVYVRLNQLPHLFKRSEIQSAYKITPPQILYFRNNVRSQDYKISFKSIESLDTFLNFFPARRYLDGTRIMESYYFIPTLTQNE